MKLVFINPSNAKRPEIYELANSLPEKHSVTILQPSKTPNDKPTFIAKNIKVVNMPVFYLPFSGAIVSIPHFRKWIEKLNELIKNNQCDLIHVCDYEYPTAFLPILIRLRFKHIAITNVSDSFAGFDYSFGSHLLDFLTGAYTRSIGKSIMLQYDKIVVIFSRAISDLDLLGLPKNKLELIPNGIQSNLISNIRNSMNKKAIREKYGFNDKDKILLSVGRLVPVKRVDLLISLVKKLNENGVNAKGLIVGTGPQMPNLKSFASTLKDKIVFTGYISEQEKYECYSIADLFILSSISEGLPTVVLEAAAFGVPTFATNTNGNPDIVLNGKTGYLINNWEKLPIEQAKKILLNKQIAEHFGKTAILHTCNNFSWLDVSKKYELLFEKVLTQRNNLQKNRS